jgi:hypothetical protein
MTGTTWIEESGFLDGPVLLTNTHSVGIVRDAFIRWQVRNKRMPGTNVVRDGAFWSMPVVAETFDGFLNDTNGFHVKRGHVVKALESAATSLPAEGSVGGGTGMICFGFKGGIEELPHARPDRTPSERWSSVIVVVEMNCASPGSPSPHRLIQPPFTQTSQESGRNAVPSLSSSQPTLPCCLTR